MIDCSLDLIRLASFVGQGDLYFLDQVVLYDEKSETE